LVVLLDGTVTFVVIFPLVQETVEGKPVTVGEEENSHVLAFATCADSVTDPPEEVSEVGAALKEDTEVLVEAPATDATPTLPRVVSTTATVVSRDATRKNR
jgi:hypothetical protein